MSDTPLDRRDFIKTASAAGLGALATSAVASPLLALRGSPNEKMVVAVMGLNGRGMVFARSCARGPDTAVGYVCDVDSTVLAKAVAATAEHQPTAAKGVADIRRVLDDKSVDALIIAAPDHWHTPAAIMALAAGKHVYVEKPVGHNARENEMLVAAARKYNRLVQVGTQRRSSPVCAEIVRAVRDGIIGKPYLARAWYANTRDTIGKGAPAAVPAHLDWELWQGPAPRTPYRDNVVHYNWHWFTRWGTGEVCNNGTHEIDVARWVLGVDYPVTVHSTGKRHHFEDDWEFPDTQEVTYEFADGKRIIWQGQSCNGLQLYGRPRGTVVMGTQGSVVIDQDGYVVYDLKNAVVKDSSGAKGDSLNTVSDDPLTQLHVENFTSAVRTGTPLSAPIAEGAKTGLVTHLGIIAQHVQRKLRIDPRNGHIVGDVAASRLWSREYDPRWRPVV
jgi:predicted dehydrogenase